MTRWNNYFYGPVATIRPYLFQKCLLLVVATDALVLMSERGSRYGLDGFNVAHFAWLDAIQPLPTATWYVGILMLVSLLGYTICFLGPSRVLLATLAVLYTYAWAMSRHDSYLHHYMISLILACMVVFPRITYADLLQAYKKRGKAAKQRQPASSRREEEAQPWPRWAGLWFVVSMLGMGLIYRTADVLAASWIAFFGFFLAVGLATAVFLRQTGILSGPRTSAWGYRLLGATVGVIYIYTSAAKADAEWCGGHTLRRIGNADEVLAPFVRWAESVGVPPDWFWSIVATTVIPLELTIAASYFLAVRQDEADRKWSRRWCVVACVLAVGLHLNNEMMNLSIQWFGYYMMFLATFFFLPERVLLALGASVVLPAHWWQTHVARPLVDEGRKSPLVIAGAVTAVAALILYATSQFIALPGALWALPLSVAVVVLHVALRQLTSMDWFRQDPTRLSSAVGLAGIVMCGVVSQSSMRHDYYWILGVEQQSLLEHGDQTQAAALAAYELAETYGAPDKDRQVELCINMGLAHRRLGDIPSALACYQRALELDPNNAHVHLNIGVAYQVAGDLVRACDSFRRATRLRSDYAIAHLELGRTLELRGELTGSLKSLRAAQKLYPNDLAIQKDVARVIGKLRETSSESFLGS